jgi:hypothetical protein
MSKIERLGFDPSLLPITHVLLKGSLIYPQSKQLHKEDWFPPGVLLTKQLPVALVPDELTQFHRPGQVLFVSPTNRFKVDFAPGHHVHIYYPPWILFGFLEPENKLTIATLINQTHRDDGYQQGQLI